MMGIKELSQRLKTKLRLAQIKAARHLATVLPEAIRFRTRYAGEGVTGPLNRIEDSTRKYRKRYEANLHPDTSPDESNLTATGQLLDSIQGKNVGDKVTISIKKGRRKGELSGGKSSISNDEVRRHVESSGREFLELTDKERKEALDEAARIIKEELRSVIK